MVEEEAEVLRGRGQEKERAERDYEMFLRELEEDKELRGMVNLYKGKVTLHFFLYVFYFFFNFKRRLGR